MTERYLLVINPWLDSQAQQRLAELKTALQQRGIPWDSYPTTADWQHDCQLLKQRAEQYSDVVAVGGDGTVNLAVNSLVGLDCRFGILPAGTGNDFYRSAYTKPEHWLSHLLAQQSINIDVGLCNQRYFINILGIGFDGDVIRGLNQQQSRRWRVLRYPWMVIKTLLRNRKHHLTIESENYQKTAPMMTALFANGRYFSRGLEVVPEADIGSQTLQGFWIPHLSLVQQVRCWSLLLLGKAIPEKYRNLWTLKQCSVISPGLAMQGDGEDFGDTPATIRVVTKALKLKMASQV